MINELKTLQDVAKAQAEGEEIEIYGVLSQLWSGWGGEAWSASSIYRTKSRHQALIDQVEADPTLQVEYKVPGRSVWCSCSGSPHWDECTEYRIKPKAAPAKRKIRMLCWLASGSLIWYAEGSSVGVTWTRVPSEDKEIEVVSGQ